VLDDECFELALFDCSALLDLLEEVAGGCFKNGAQVFSLPSVFLDSGRIGRDGDMQKPLLSAAG
jgi:hypothetical protein